MVDLSVVVVSYNVVGLLRRCVASVYQESGYSIELFVVDNASTDGSAPMVQAEFPSVRLIQNAENVGFVRANNQALRLAVGRYLLLLNPDAEVRPGALGTMIAYLDASLEVGALGPKLLNADGSVQSSRRRFPTRATGFVESTVVQQWWPSCRLLGRYYCSDVPDDVPQEVDWVTGACLMVRREAVEQVGLLDERFFMYSEELDWCYRIKRAGWKVVYLPSAEVVHYEARSSEQNLARRSIFFNDSKCRFYAKHYGAGWGLVLRLFIFLTFVYQLMVEGVKYILGHRRQLRRRRLATLVEVLGWQVRHWTGAVRA